MFPAEKLPNELWLRIIKQADDDPPRQYKIGNQINAYESLILVDSHRSIFSVAAVSKRFNALATDIIYRHLILTLSISRHDSNMNLFDRLDKNKGLALKVQRITIDHLMDPQNRLLPRDISRLGDESDEEERGDDENQEHGIGQIKKMVAVLPRLRRLQTLSWNVHSRIPVSILSTVHLKLPDCTVDLPINPMDNDSRSYLDNIGYLENIVEFPCISSLSSNALHDDVPKMEVSYMENLVSRCQKLKSLALWTWPEASPPFGSPLRKHPSLKELYLMEYYIQYPYEWQNMMDWSQIHTLHVAEPTFDCLAPKLTGLKSLHIYCVDQYDPGKDVVPGFRGLVLGCHRLEQLSTNLDNQILDKTMIQHLGESLQTLVLDNRDPLSIGNILGLGFCCPNLRSLSCCVKLTNEWPPKALTLLASHLQNVSDLEIHLARDNRHWQQTPRVLHSHISVANIWSQLWKMREDTRGEEITSYRPRQGLKSLRLSGPFDCVKASGCSQTPVQYSIPITTQLGGTFCHCDDDGCYERMSYHVEFNIRLSNRHSEWHLGIATITDDNIEMTERLSWELNKDSVQTGSWVETVVPSAQQQGDAEDRKPTQRPRSFTL